MFTNEGKVQIVKASLGILYSDTGKIPNQREGLSILANNSSDYKNWNGPYLSETLYDLWRNDIKYIVVRDGYYLISPGDDGVFDTSDDVIIHESFNSLVHFYLYNLAELVDRYFNDTGRYPTQEEGLIPLVEKPNNVNNWNGPYIATINKDIWGQDIIYKLTDDGYFVYSAGKDGEYPTKDDVIVFETYSIRLQDGVSTSGDKKAETLLD